MAVKTNLMQYGLGGRNGHTPVHQESNQYALTPSARFTYANLCALQLISVWLSLVFCCNIWGVPFNLDRPSLHFEASNNPLASRACNVVRLRENRSKTQRGEGDVLQLAASVYVQLNIFGWWIVGAVQQEGNSDSSVEALCQLKYVREWGEWEDESRMLMTLPLSAAMDDSPSMWGS